MPYKYYEKIREMREDRKLSQQDIADLLHIGQRTRKRDRAGQILRCRSELPHRNQPGKEPFSRKIVVGCKWPAVRKSRGGIS